MSEAQSDNSTSPIGENKTPEKRTPSKRLSVIERAQRESEELIKNMGGSLDVEGGRKTRSSTRGRTPSTPTTPTPAKKPRTSSTPRRGRPKKNIALSDDKGEDNAASTKLDSAEGETSKLQENCNESDTTTNSKIDTVSSPENATKEETDEKEVVDAPLPPIVEENSESIKADSENKVECNENNVESEKEEEKTPEQKTSENQSENTDEKVTASVTIEDGKPTTQATIVLDPVEPMEVDGAPAEKNQSPAQTAKDEVKPTETVTVDSSSEVDEDVVEVHSDEDVVEVGEQVLKEANKNVETPNEEKTHNTTESRENSIVEKSAENDAVNVEATIEESKKENDVCEPKITATQADVVAMQTCN